MYIQLLVTNEEHLLELWPWVRNLRWEGGCIVCKYHIHCILAIISLHHTHHWVESKVGRGILLKYSIDYTLPESLWGWLIISLLSEIAATLPVMYHKKFPVSVGSSYTLQYWNFASSVVMWDNLKFRNGNNKHLSGGLWMRLVVPWEYMFRWKIL